MRIILTGYGYHIGKRSGMIVIKKSSGEKKEYSVGNIDELVVHSRGISFSGEALALLMKHGVKVYFIDRLRIRGKLMPFSRGSSITIKKRQFQHKDDELGRYLARRFISGKVYNQVSYLRQLRRRFRRDKYKSEVIKKSIEDVKDIQTSIESLNIYNGDYREQIISKEGEVAKIYWSVLASLLSSELGFDGRRKRFEGPRDPINISLNYLYTLLAGYVWIEVELSGLEPFMGFLHKDSPRRPALVMDLMEEFRVPVVDKPLFTYIFDDPSKPYDWMDENSRLNDDSRRFLAETFFKRMDEKVTFLNRSYKLKFHIQLQCKRLIRCLMGYSKEYPTFRLTK